MEIQICKFDVENILLTLFVQAVLARKVQSFMCLAPSVPWILILN